MALFAKKFYVSKNGVNYAHDVFSRTSDISNTTYMRITVDGSTGYVGADYVGTSGQSPGRIKKNNGSTYALIQTQPVEYDYQLFWSNSSFTVPARVTSLRISCIGGGCGGVVHPEQSCKSSSFTGNRVKSGVAGGSTYVTRNSSTLVSANGASAPKLQVKTSWQSDPSKCPNGGYYDAVTSHTASKGTTSQSFQWSANRIYGSGPVYIYFYDGGTAAQAGDGGYADNDVAEWECAGANGYKTVKTVSVSPGQTLSVVIGDGGASQWQQTLKYSNWSTSGASGQIGSQGVCLIEWGGSI